MTDLLPQSPDLILTIDGARFDDIKGFYAEVNRVFMTNEDWRLGESLDALDDLFYGGYGALQGADSVRLQWRCMDKSAADLGHDATRRWLADKLRQPQFFNPDTIRNQLAALDAGSGQTFFQIVLQIIKGHPKLELLPG